jgi:hypothetical protein
MDASNILLYSSVSLVSLSPWCMLLSYVLRLLTFNSPTLSSPKAIRQSVVLGSTLPAASSVSIELRDNQDCVPYKPASLKCCSTERVKTVEFVIQREALNPTLQWMCLF